MGYWIEQLGFWGYMQRFPINPISIVGTVLIVGIVVLFINASMRRSQAEDYARRNKTSAIVTLHKKRIGDTDYADNIRIDTLNGEAAHWFFLKPAIPALYLKTGTNTVTLHAEWARGGGVSVKMYSTEPVPLTLEVAANGHYSLEYVIPEDRFLFEEYDNPHLFDD